MSGQTTLEPAAGPSRRSAARDPRRRSRRLIAIALVIAGLLGLAAYWLFGTAEPRVAGITTVFPQEPITTVVPGREVCQGTRVPAGTGAVQVLSPQPSRDLSVRVVPEQGPGVRAASRSTRVREGNGGAMLLALDRTFARDQVSRICMRTASAPMPVLGDRSNGGMTVAGRPAEGAVALTFFRAGNQTAAQMLPVVAERIGRMRGAFGGAWRGVAIVLLLAAGLALSAWLLVTGGRAGRRRVWLALWAVAACNALAWSLLTPALQIPDEPSHISYVQDLVEKGQPPQPIGSSLSPELNVVVDVVGVSHVNFRRDARPPWTKFDDGVAAARLGTKPSRVNPAWYLPVSDYPPVYYAAVSPLYRATTAAGGSTLDAITPIRAVSALLAGLAVIAVFGFLLELFRGERRFTALGIALICAYQPLLAFISGGVTPDALLIPLGASMFWLFARAFRRGLTWPLAAGLGLLLAASLLTKIAALGFIPGWLAGMALLLWRARPQGPRRVLGAGALAAACAGVPTVAYLALNKWVWDRPVLPTGLTGAGAETAPPAPAGGPAQAVSGFTTYLWEYFLPRFGPMTDFFHSRWAPKDLWVPMWVGRFGWSDYGFPNWFNRGALVLYSLIAVAAAVGLVRLLRARRGDWAPIAVSALIGIGLIVAIGKAGYPLRASGNYIFEQGRYYLPLLPVFALAIALAVRLLRERAANAVVIALVVVSVGQFGGALAMTIQRYYTFEYYIEQENAIAATR